MRPKLFLIACTSVICSCTSYKSLRNGYINGVEYYNDSIPLYATFFGDIVFEKPDKVNKHNIRKKIKGIKNISANDLLLYGTTNVPPYYEVLFFAKKIKLNNKDIDSIKVTKDTTQNRVIFRKSYREKEATLVLSLVKNLNSYTSIIADGKTIINSITDDKNKKKLSYYSIFNNYHNESNFLYVIDKLDKAPIKNNKKNTWEKHQLLATLLANDPDSKRYKDLLHTFESNVQKRCQKYVDSIIEKQLHFNSITTIGQIKKLASTTRLIMLNENHWKPNHRIVAQKLLEPLFKQGYKYLAIEAVDRAYDSIINHRKYPVKNNGFYTREPHFGLFIRKALELGFTIVGYDDFTTANREETQAKNIKNILDKDAGAKIFVYAGIDHILEGSPSKKRMAQYLKELTGIDPVTIDQVEVIANTKEDITLIESKLLKKSGKINTNVDYFLINNITSGIEKIFDQEEISEIVINKNALKDYIGKNVLISVYYKHEYDRYKSNSIPIMNTIVNVRDQDITIIIPTSTVTVKIKDIDNNTILLKDYYTKTKKIIKK